MILHERPGVYSEFTVTGITSPRAGALSVAVVAVPAAAGEMKALLKAGGIGRITEKTLAASPNTAQYTAAFAELEALEGIDIIVCDSSDTAVLTALRDSVTAASGARRERIAVAAALSDVPAQAAAQAALIGSERVILAAPRAADAKGYTIAAALAAAIGAEADPALPLHGALLPGISGLSREYDDDEIDTLVRGGVTVLEYAAGAASVVRGVTTRTKTGGAPDATWRDITTVRIADSVMAGLRNALRARFARSKNTAQVRSAVQSQVVMELEGFKARQIIDGYADVTVTPRADDAAVCDVGFSFAVAHGLNHIVLSVSMTV